MTAPQYLNLVLDLNKQLNRTCGVIIGLFKHIILFLDILAYYLIMVDADPELRFFLKLRRDPYQYNYIL